MESIAGIAAVVGAGVAIAVVIPRFTLRQRKKIVGAEVFLRQRGGMTLDELACTLGTNFFARAYLLHALDQLVTEGRLVKIPPPQGHSVFRRARDTRYMLCEAKAG